MYVYIYIVIHHFLLRDSLHNQPTIFDSVLGGFSNINTNWVSLISFSFHNQGSWIKRCCFDGLHFLDGCSNIDIICR